MATSYTDNFINQLIINKVPSKAIYDEMVANNQVNDNELYLVADAESSSSTPLYLDQENQMAAAGKITMDSSYTPSANKDVATKDYVDNKAPTVTPTVGTSTSNQIYIGSTAPASGTSPLIWIDTSSSGILKYRTSTSGTWTAVPVGWTN